MEHLKNIAAGLAGMAAICSAGAGVWWFSSNYPKAFMAIIALPFITTALWGFGRALRDFRSGS